MRPKPQDRSPNQPRSVTKVLLAPKMLALFFLLLGILWKIFAPGPPWVGLGEHPGDNFGTKVVAAGDVNGDGFADVAVWASNAQNYAGKVYVYYGSKRGPAPSPSWTAQGEAQNDQFGRSFGTVGDVNGDGLGDFIVAAQGFDAPNSTDTGKAYLYFGSTQGLGPRPDWTRTGDSPHELFGDCSGRAGDIDHDGIGDVIIGAFGYADGVGRAYVFLGSKTGPLPQPVWHADGENPNDWYGYSVASVGNIRGDHRPSLLIGAKQHSKGKLHNVGKVYVYDSDGKGLSHLPTWTAEGEDANDLFGWRALPAGDVAKTGYDGIIVSAYEHGGPSGANAGRVYFYPGSPQGLSAQPTWFADGEQAGALFGYSIASGDFNGDGYSDIVVGSSGFKNHTGKIYLYLGGPQGLGPSPSWTADGPTLDSYFGAYVANGGDVNGDGLPDLIVGSPYDSENGDKAGKAYLFYGSRSGKLRTRP